MSNTYSKIKGAYALRSQNTTPVYLNIYTIKLLSQENDIFVLCVKRQIFVLK
jgi:hypothetical protein